MSLSNFETDHARKKLKTDNQIDCKIKAKYPRTKHRTMHCSTEKCIAVAI